MLSPSRVAGDIRGVFSGTSTRYDADAGKKPSEIKDTPNSVCCNLCVRFNLAHRQMEQDRSRGEAPKEEDQETQDENCRLSARPGGGLGDSERLDENVREKVEQGHRGTAMVRP